MPPVTTLELDPAITPELLDHAHAAEASDFAAIVATLDLDERGQDDLDELGAGTSSSPPPRPRHSTTPKALSVSGRVRGGRLLPPHRPTGRVPDPGTLPRRRDRVGSRPILKHLTSDPASDPQGGRPVLDQRPVRPRRARRRRRHVLDHRLPPPRPRRPRPHRQPSRRGAEASWSGGPRTSTASTSGPTSPSPSRRGTSTTGSGSSATPSAAPRSAGLAGAPHPLASRGGSTSSEARKAKRDGEA
jgi:hypothetical protein